MKKYIKTCVAMLMIIATLGSLFGCSSPDLEDTAELIAPYTEGCPISSIRTGIYRQGIYALENGFECTENGTYYMCMFGGGHWLLYSDHGSDTVIKLCGRPDCTHSDRDCNAYFETGVNICYYEGYLYTYGKEGSAKGIIRLDLDGSNRVLVYNLSEFMSENGSGGLVNPRIWNGIFSVGLKKLNSAGEEVYERYYYKLDGSMQSPQRTSTMGFVKNDGNVFCGVIGYDSDNQQYIYGKWNPDDGTSTELFRDSKMCTTGYIGSDAIYYIENGIIYKFSYDTKSKTALFDTGLQGNSYQLSCFPDMVVVSDYVDVSTGDSLEKLTMYFYDWKFNSLGSVDIDYELAPVLSGVICGETHERLILTDSTKCIPRYYINKEDLGTGKIKINKYTLIDLE